MPITKMARETTTKKKPEDKDEAQASLKERVLALESKNLEFEKELTAAVKRIEMIKSAVAEGRLDKL